MWCAAACWTDSGALLQVLVLKQGWLFYSVGFGLFVWFVDNKNNVLVQEVSIDSTVTYIPY